MVNYKLINLNMTNSKKISYLIFALCVLQWPMHLVESAVSAVASNSKAAYARTDDKGQEVSSSILGSIYHKSRQSRCVTCYEDRRYGDDRSRYYGSYAARSGDDRASSWYYSGHDRYEDRGYRGADYDRYAAPVADRYGADRYGADRYGADRYGADRYGADRYGADRYGADKYGGYRDDRYGARPAYDRYDTRTRVPYERPAAYDRGESRGYGYDNRDRYYGADRGSSDYYGRDRYYDRPRYGAGAGAASGYGSYDRDYYDRYSPRYDFRQYRPWDDSYRGQSSYDSTGHGQYYAKGTQEDRRYLPEPGYNSPAISPCGVRKPNCPYDPQEGGTRVTSGTIDSGSYNMGVSQTTYNTNSHTNRNDSSKGSGSTGGWSYMREDDEQPSRGGSNNSGSNASNSNNNNRDRNRDQQSSAYGALLDRDSNLIAVEPVKSNDNANNDSMASSDQQMDKNAEETGKQSDNGQNS
ncbi:probable serine/threonine-protein kinase clkA isoform X1 [Lucilia cuprina]|uniref:probable serine/threonine-protein kinase clkA isoform X1 n=1 Tax=Lucilia cuprina TaxID=7375 RepID=UPI001F06EB91|nr:probable serine/threonine-protein kinase clkA isoform X1 [Lucilia cuprina]